jgi:hypothetical protein
LNLLMHMQISTILQGPELYTSCLSRKFGGVGYLLDVLM